MRPLSRRRWARAPSRSTAGKCHESATGNGQRSRSRIHFAHRPTQRRSRNRKFQRGERVVRTITGGAGGIRYPIQVDGSSTLTLAASCVMQAMAVAIFLCAAPAMEPSVARSSDRVPPATSSTKPAAARGRSRARTASAAYVISGGTLTLGHGTGNAAKLSSGQALSRGRNAQSQQRFLHRSHQFRPRFARRFGGEASGSGVLRQMQSRASAGWNGGLCGLHHGHRQRRRGQILGGYATVAGADWAHSGAAADTAVNLHRLHGHRGVRRFHREQRGDERSFEQRGRRRRHYAGRGRDAISTLLQNTCRRNDDTSAGTLRLGATGGVLIPSGKQTLTISATQTPTR